MNGSRIFQLHKEIMTISQGTNTTSTYFSRIRQLWVEFVRLALIPGCYCEKSRDFFNFMSQQKFLQFLMGLNHSYKQARGQIMTMDPLPSVNKAYSMLIERESQCNMISVLGTVENTEVTALMTAKGNTGNNQKFKKNYNLYCDYCKMKGHTGNGCYKLIGYPADFKYKKRLVEMLFIIQ